MTRIKFKDVPINKITKVTTTKEKLLFKIKGRKKPISIMKSQTNLLKKMAIKLIEKKKTNKLSKKMFKNQFKKKPSKVIGHRERGDNIIVTYIDRKKNLIKTKLKWERDENIIDRLINKKLIKRRILTTPIKKGIIDVINSPGSITLDISKKRAIEILDFMMNNIKLSSELIYMIKYGGMVYTLNSKMINYIKEVAEFGIEVIIGEEGEGSDASFITEIYKQNEITLLSVKRKEKRRKQDAGFFKYLSKDLHFDEWERYGIYHDFHAGKYDEMNCLVKAIYEHGNVSKEIIESLKLKCTNMNIPFKKVEEIAKQYKLYIEIKYLRDLESPARTKKIGKKAYDKHFKIGCIDDHYFILDYETKITSYALNNFEDVKNIKDFNKIIKKNKGKYMKSNKRFISSYDLIHKLLSNKDKFLRPLTWGDVGLRLSHFYNKCPNVKDLSYITTDISKHKKKTRVNKDNDLSNKRKLFFDVETITKNRHQVHTLCWYDDRLKKAYGLTGDNCVKKFLEKLNGDELLLAHNLGYEFNFLFKHLFAITYIKRGKMIMSATGKYKKRDGETIDLHFKDTLSLIPKGLAKFPKMFGLKNIKKEIMPYNLFTKENITVPCVKISEALSFIKKKDHIEFIKNIDEWKLRVGKDKFKHMEYSRIYCEMDCYITALGYNTFKGWVKDLCGAINEKFYKKRKKKMKIIDVDNVVSTASLAFKFFDFTDCYKGCFKLAGTPREFIQKCVVGGRTMTRDNKKWKVKGNLDDFDACSLYPSAIKKLIGFLKGKPKIINDESYEELNKYDGYFAEVNIINCPKSRHFPLLNRKNEKGIRNFSNDIRGSIFIDKIGLEDLVKFHKMVPEVDFKIVRGYYFNKGRNNKASKIIKFLYDERVKLKDQDNPAQEIYKLIMNSSYGKTIMKPIDEEINILSGERADIFISRNHNKIKEIISVGDKKIIKTHKSISDHFSYPHIGSEILSMSKRIMNEVMCLAEDLGIKIFYQDTDSMHIDQSKVKLLADKFYDDYKKVLIGKGMGQFHGDFDFDCDEGHSPVAVESWFLGKKMYLDKIKCVNNGEINYKYHARLKGIPSYCIKNKELIYTKLLLNTHYEFQIADIADEMNKPLFEFTKDFKIFKNTKLKRKVKALGKYEKDFV